MNNKKKTKRTKKYRFKHRTITPIGTEHFSDDSQQGDCEDDREPNSK